MSDIEKNSREYLPALKSLLIEAGVFTLVLVIIFRGFFGIAVQHGDDMYPAIRDGDLILYYRTGSIINTEAVVYRADGGIHTGRVAASEGTSVGMTADMQLTFDGLFLPVSERDGIYSRTYSAEGEKLPFTVDEGCYFILGDNRDSACDSRIYGQINSRDILGRIVTVMRRRQI